MKIETKYEIGQKIWYVYEHDGEACVYDDVISWISLEKDGLYYGLGESCNDCKEEDIILYEDEEKLINKIKDIMQKWRNENNE